MKLYVNGYIRIKEPSPSKKVGLHSPPPPPTTLPRSEANPNPIYEVNVPKILVKSDSVIVPNDILVDDFFATEF